MKLPLTIATLLLVTTTALPAFATAPTGHSFYQHQGYSYRSNAYGLHRHPTVNGYNAYAAEPNARPQVRSNGWGHCVSGLEEGGRSAFPSWDVC